MSDMELNSIMTRVGQRSTIIFCGDFRQTDLKKSSDVSGLTEFMDTVSLMPMVGVFEFGLDDIVRAPLVKAYLIARMHVKDMKTRPPRSAKAPRGVPVPDDTGGL